MSFTAIEVDGASGETIVVAQGDGTTLAAHVGPDRIVRMAPGLLGIGVMSGQPYIDPQGAAAGEAATLVYDPATGSLYIESLADPQVKGLKLERPAVIAPRQRPVPARSRSQSARAKVRRAVQAVLGVEGREEREQARQAFRPLDLTAAARARALRDRLPAVELHPVAEVADIAPRLANARTERDSHRAAATLPVDQSARTERDSARHPVTLHATADGQHDRDAARHASTLTPDPESQADRAYARNHVLTLSVEQPRHGRDTA